MWRIEQIEKEPSPRCAHQSDSIGDFMYVFGGWNDENQMLNDVHRFNSISWEWEDLKLQYSNNIDNNTSTNTSTNNNNNNTIIPRNGHTMNSYKNQLVVFAGGSFSGFLNDILIISPDTLKWTQIQTQSNSQHPSGRSKHASCLLGDSLYIFGGGDGIRLYNDMFYLDLITWTWNLVEPSGEIAPSPRWGHSMIVLPNQKHLLLFGGHSGTKRLNDLYLFNSETRQWIQIDYSKLEHNQGIIPHPRAGHSASMIGDKHMLLFGGGDGKIINDNYLLDTSIWKWWKMSKDLPPEGRCAHSSSLIKNKLIIFGGGNGLQCLKKLLVLDAIDQIENLYKDFKLNQNQISNTSPNNNISNINNNTTNSNIKKIKNQINDLNSTLSQLSSTIELKAKKIIEEKEKEKQSLSSSPSSSSSSPSLRINNNNFSESLNIKNSRLNRYEIRDISYFLNQIGMSKYINKFIEEEIDTTVLHLLTEDHLKQLEIKSLGDRLTIVKGIRESTLYLFKGSPRISTEYDPNQIPQFIEDL